MADIFSTVAGVASVIDVALRGCNALYESIHYLKDAPQLSLRLRRTVQSVESILRCLDDFVAIHCQQKASAGVSAILPDAVTLELVSIRDDLDALSILLPTSSSRNQLRRRLKWVLDRKQVAEVTQRLNSRQTTLSLALQSFAQRNGISVNKHVSGRLGQIERQHEDSVEELKGSLDIISTELRAELDVVTQACTKSLPAQEHLDARFKELHELISSGQDALKVKLDTLGVSQSKLHVNHSQVQSSTVLAAQTEDVLVRMFRAEVRRVVMPTVQQCFNTFKANSDHQVDEIKWKMDEMAQQFGSKLGETERENNLSSYDPLPKVYNEPTHLHQDQANLTASCNLDISAPIFAKRQNNSHGRHIRQWRRSWTFRWTIGTLWVKVMSITSRKTSPEFRIGEFPSPQKTYGLIIEFQPAQNLVQLRGLTLSVTSTQDQRGYSQICPLISTFAVVHFTAKIMVFARHNDVKGIRDLFERRLAAPSDRNDMGETPLMLAAQTGSLEACQFLLSEGSDPSAMNEEGYNLFDYTNLGFMEACRRAEESFFDDKNYVLVIEALLQAQKSAIKDSETHKIIPLLLLLYIRHQRVLGQSATSTMTRPPYLQRLKELGFKLDEHESFTILAYFTREHIKCVGVQYSSEHIEATLRTLVDLGVDLCPVDVPLQLTPLEMIFWKDEDRLARGPLHHWVEVATAFLKNGADPYALDHFGYSLFDAAEGINQTSILLQALERAGYDVNEVLAEIQWRQWCFDNPSHGFAESTAVDSDEIAQPSAEGLVLRKRIRGDRDENG